MQVPSVGNQQPWEFLVVAGKLGSFKPLEAEDVLNIYKAAL